jgi:hypothetical protein
MPLAEKLLKIQKEIKVNFKILIRHSNQWNVRNF